MKECWPNNRVINQLMTDCERRNQDTVSQFMAYFHCWTQIRIQTQTQIPVLCRIFSIGSDSNSDPLIEMYVIGTEICLWDRDLCL